MEPRVILPMQINPIRLFGTLDRCLSEMKYMAQHPCQWDAADLQTLKHHADDMRLLAGHIDKKLTDVEL